jgi:hypothetical protein
MTYVHVSEFAREYVRYPVPCLADDDVEVDATPLMEPT